jgi:cytochrome c-type biogenesis protein CcmH/NrfG
MALMTVLAAANLLSQPVFGQGRGGASTAPSSGSAGTTSGAGTTTSGKTTGNVPGTPTPGTAQPQIIYISGRVALEDGTAPDGPVVIERVCNGSAHAEGYTDTKGYFSFQLGGQNTMVMQDASESNSPRGFGGGQSGMGGTSGGMGGMGSMGSMSSMGSMGSGMNLANCEIRARLGGFRSQSVNLMNRRALDDPNIGTILLHRAGASEGTTISAVSLSAPKDARKAFEKGQDAAKKQKPDEAVKDYERAVDLYPKYAAAWCELGKLQARQSQAEAARKSFDTAIEADPKFVEPYLQVSQIDLQGRQWQDLADISDRALKLDPFDYPREFFLNAVAHFNLKQVDAAEKSVREAERLDTRHETPDSEHLLGVILAQRQDYTGAAEHLRAYLQYRPDASDAEAVRKQLAQIEKVQAQAAPPPTP